MSVIEKMSEENYNNLPMVRNSDLSSLLKSYKHYLIKKNEKTGAMDLGSAFHCYILENDKFSERYVIVPENSPKKPTIAQINAKKPAPETLVQIEFWNNFYKEHEGKEVLTKDDFNTILEMKKSLEEHPISSKILKNKELKSEIVMTANIENIECKTKCDILLGNFIFDLKSCLDASPEGFKKSIGKYDYSRQAAFYLDMARANNLDIKEFGFIAVESTAPYSVGIYVLDEASLELGRLSYKKALNVLSSHKDNPKLFSGYSDQILTISAPNWQFYGSEVNGI